MIDQIGVPGLPNTRPRQHDPACVRADLRQRQAGGAPDPGLHPPELIERTTF